MIQYNGFICFMIQYNDFICFMIQYNGFICFVIQRITKSLLTITPWIMFQLSDTYKSEVRATE